MYKLLRGLQVFEYAPHVFAKRLSTFHDHIDFLPHDLPLLCPPTELEFPEISEGINLRVHDVYDSRELGFHSSQFKGQILVSQNQSLLCRGNTIPSVMASLN